MMLFNKIIDGVYQSAERLGIERDVINYGAKTQFLFIGECTISLITASLFDLTLYALEFIIVFTYLRAYCGGYHCKSYLSCTCFYVFIVTSSILLSQYMIPSISIFLALFSTLSLFILSPVQNENNRLNSIDRKKYKKTARIRICLTGCLYILICSIKYMYYSFIISLALTWLTILCFMQLLAERRETWTLFTN